MEKKPIFVVSLVYVTNISTHFFLKIRKNNITLLSNNKRQM